MNRRALLETIGLLAWGLTGCAARATQPSYKISAEQLHKTLAQRFPMRQSLVAGWLHLDLLNPRLRLLPESNRIGSAFDVNAAGPALRHSYSGMFDVDFGLRYEASDLSIRATQLRVNSLRIDHLPRDTAELLATYGPALAESALQDVVLHRLRPQDLALPDGLGLQPGSITVVPEGLVIGFVPKQETR